MPSNLPYHGNKKYLIYKKGKVYSKYSGRYIGRQNTSGEPIVDLKDKKTGEVSTHKVKHLVAQHFLPNPDNLPCVIILNHKPYDCRAQNLRWTSLKDAVAHAKKKPKYKRSGNKNKRSDERRLSTAANFAIAKRSPHPKSSTFIEDQNHAESIFLP